MLKHFPWFLLDLIRLFYVYHSMFVCKPNDQMESLKRCFLSIYEWQTHCNRRLNIWDFFPVFFFIGFVAFKQVKIYLIRIRKQIKINIGSCPFRTNKSQKAIEIHICRTVKFLYKKKKRMLLIYSSV